MDTSRAGLILFTERYDECVAFYLRVLGLSVWFSKPELTCFRFGDAYLMVERGGVAAPGEKSRAMSPLVLRLNVVDIQAACATLHERGVGGAAVTRFAWGDIVHLLDPDGNSIQLCQWPADRAIPQF